MKKEFNYFFVSSIFIICGILACQTDSGKLSPEEKYALDTIAPKHVNDWQRKLDSLCTSYHDSLYVKLVDSLKSERFAEIEALLIKN